MGRFLDLTGERFTRLIAIKQHSKNKHGHYLWFCKCDCGNEKIILGQSLINEDTKSCGCLQKEKVGKHGYSQTKTYRIWHSMIERCKDINNEYYGKKEIKVCDKWLAENNGFVNFLKDMGECPGKEYSIDRINNDLGYYKENCKWSTSKQQTRNKSNNINVTFNNKTQCTQDFAKEYNINRRTLQYKIKRGLSIEEILTTSTKRGETK
jgi:hypothetical protein